MNKTFAVNLLLTLSYCLAIFIQSSFPTPGAIPSIPFLDKALHFLGYGVLGILFFRAFESMPRSRMGLKAVILLSMAASAFYGITDEIHQHFVPYRNADIIDWVFDVLGSVFGACIYPYILGRFKLRLTTDIHGKLTE